MTNTPSAINCQVPPIQSTRTGTISNEFVLNDYAGKKIILYFYPKDNTPGCTTESIAFRDIYQQLLDANAVLFGISRDSLRSHEAFKAKLALPFDLISDPDEIVCNLFNVMKIKNMYGKKVRGIERSTFIIDESGKLVKEWRGVKVVDHAKTVLEFVSAHN